MKAPVPFLQAINPAKTGIAAALGSAFLFGVGAPLSKWLLVDVSPWILAGLLYLGSGVGLAIYRGLRGAARPQLMPGELKWLVAAVACGGAVAPVLLMWGLAAMPASHAALLLNAEAVLTAVLAWGVFKENFDTRIAVGMAAIVVGALLLCWPAGSGANLPAASVWPALAVVLACFFWAIDNNFTRKVALSDASWIACVKGLAAGVSNLALAFSLGAALPGVGTVVSAMGVGLLAYGVSLALFVVALRDLGTSRAGAYFSTAPFVGALLSVLFLAEPVTWQLLAAAAFMAFGLCLHLTEHHAHAHQHGLLEHEHRHIHSAQGGGDGHHAHSHVPAFMGAHSHHHRHELLNHSHAHYPDAHHRHEH